VKQDLICKECGGQRDIGRRLCRPCNLERLKKSNKERPRYMWDKKCEACNHDYKAWRKNQKLCSSCNKQRLSVSNPSTNNYIMVGNRGEHRVIAEQLIGRKLKTNEIVHHINDDPKDNRLENLMLMDRTIHTKLHAYLATQRVIIEKSMNENSGNCWNSLIAPMTTAWLETTSAKVKKLSEIGQSAAEPLTEKSNEEGSET